MLMLRGTGTVGRGRWESADKDQFQISKFQIISGKKVPTRNPRMRFKRLNYFFTLGNDLEFSDLSVSIVTTLFC